MWSPGPDVGLKNNETPAFYKRESRSTQPLTPERSSPNLLGIIVHPVIHSPCLYMFGHHCINNWYLNQSRNIYFIQKPVHIYLSSHTDTKVRKVQNIQNSHKAVKVSQIMPIVPLWAIGDRERERERRERIH